MIDLHSHSTFSDGSDTPERLVELAVDAGCSALALTDHDGLDGIGRAASKARELDLELVPGCEVSCAFGPGTMHVLCYFVEPGRGPLQDELARLRADRHTRNLLLVERLAHLGIPVTYDEVAEIAGGEVIGRPHFARALLRRGLVSSIDDAFDTYLAKGRPAYVSKTRIDAGEVAALTAASGGLAVLAHPLSLGLEPDALEAEVARLADLGLTGLEAYYSRYDLATRERLVGLARRCGLVPTGGSDYHGLYKPDLRLGRGTGDLSVPDEVLEELRSRLRA